MQTFCVTKKEKKGKKKEKKRNYNFVVLYRGQVVQTFILRYWRVLKSILENLCSIYKNTVIKIGCYKFCWKKHHKLVMNYFHQRTTKDQIIKIDSI